MNAYLSKKITLLNVFSTMLIVILHAKSPERFGLDLNMDNPFIYVMSAFAQLGVPVFFFLSALLFYRNFKISKLTEKLRKRIPSLVVPYLLWNIIFVSIYFTISHVDFLSNKMNVVGHFNSLEDVLFAIIWSRNSDLWFVRDLIIYSICSPIIYFLLRNKVFSFVVYMLSIIWCLIGDWGYESIWRWFPIYLSGAIVGRFYLEKENDILKYDKFRYRLIRNCGVVALFLMLFVLSLSNDSVLSVFRIFAPILVWKIVDFFLVDYISNRFKVRKWMSYMFFIYCTHHFVLNVIQKLVVLNFEPTKLVLNLTFIITPVLTVLLLVKVADMLSSYKIYKLLSGGR